MNDKAIPKTIGLIAGAGTLPVEFVSRARSLGVERIVAQGFAGQTPKEVADNSDFYQEIGFGQLNKAIRFFKEHDASDIILLGWVEPKLAISNFKMDFRMLALAARTRDRRADSVLRALIDEIARDGIHVLNTTDFLPHLLVEKGVLTKKKPSKNHYADIALGKKAALTIGGLDIGQTVVVRKHAVVAVEAMEGTDKCVRRSGEFGSGGVIVKMAKPEQDKRFDVPCFGPKTIESMIEAKSAVLAIEAGSTFIIEREKTIALANTNGIVIVGIEREE